MLENKDVCVNCLHPRDWHIRLQHCTASHCPCTWFVAVGGKWPLTA